MLLGAVKQVAGENSVSQKEIDELTYNIEESYHSIHRYKCHLMRAFAQNSSWQSLLSEEKLNHAIGQQDWSMNFLAMEFRESQANWYGKKVRYF